MPYPSSQSLERFVQQFEPLNRIPTKYHSQLVSSLRLITIASGEKFIRKPKQSTVSHFLLKGRIEVRESFDNRHAITHHDQRRVALEEQVTENGTIKAITPCVVMVINNDTINQYLLWNENYEVLHFDEDELCISSDVLIDDDFEDDWENVFIQSPLAANLSNTAIHQLMSRLENIPVKANQTIIEARSSGDYFYLIKKGEAQVQTELNGPFSGEVIQLNAGDYFGDEALIAGTPRNASVVMNTDGLLGRLDMKSFNSIVKELLIPYFEPRNNNHHDDSEIKVLDVRFPAEYRQGHEAGSTNLPISHLRKQLPSLENSYLYVLAPANDKRSELATYLMRQAGFNAYQLISEPVLNQG